MVDVDDVDEADGTPWIRLSDAARVVLDANPGDAVLVSDRRWWFGGLSRCTVSGESTLDAKGVQVELGPAYATRVVGKSSEVVIERLL